MVNNIIQQKSPNIFFFILKKFINLLIIFIDVGR